jgi:hypothetical protein
VHVHGPREHLGLVPPHLAQQLEARRDGAVAAGRRARRSTAAIRAESSARPKGFVT